MKCKALDEKPKLVAFGNTMIKIPARACFSKKQSCCVSNVSSNANQLDPKPFEHHSHTHTHENKKPHVVEHIDSSQQGTFEEFSEIQSQGFNLSKSEFFKQGHSGSEIKVEAECYTSTPKKKVIGPPQLRSQKIESMQEDFFQTSQLLKKNKMARNISDESFSKNISVQYLSNETKEQLAMAIEQSQSELSDGDIKDILIDILIQENNQLRNGIDFSDGNASTTFSYNSHSSSYYEDKAAQSITKRRGCYWQNIDQPTINIVKKIIKKTLSPHEIVDFFRTNLDGRFNQITTSFGSKLRMYADYTASGQELRIVRLLMNTITENYSNTHTDASHDGKFMNTIFHQAESAILNSVKADPALHTVIPVGSGATGAIEMIQKILGTYIPPKTKQILSKVTNYSTVVSKLRELGELPLVIITGYEHHSNDITWRNQVCDVKTVELKDDGFLDYEMLEHMMKENHPKYSRIIVSFSAGSNVTGIKTDSHRVVSIVKSFPNALVFFDYAGVGAYVTIDMTDEIDGLYLSPHKFIGGPGAAGIAIIKNRIYSKDLAPTHGGGGTVDFVNENKVVYTDDINEREKSGTPGILQTIRAGLVFMMKDMVAPYIEEREHVVLGRFFQRFGNDKRVWIFGPQDSVKRVSIISFNIKHFAKQGDRILHPVFVIRLLSDLFGVQGRAGCSCAGPYGHRLLNIPVEKSERFLDWIRKGGVSQDSIGFKGIKLGWARLNLHYILSDIDIEYIFDCIDFIATYGHRFLVDYVFDPVKGTWENLEEIKLNDVQLGFELLLKEKSYVKNEEARTMILKEQLAIAYRIAALREENFPLDPLNEWQDLATFYVAKGNLQNSEILKGCNSCHHASAKC